MLKPFAFNAVIGLAVAVFGLLMVAATR